MWETIHNEILPNALMIGVPYELFWELNPYSLAPFIKAFSLKRIYDDEVAWQHGAYIRMAIASSFSKENKYPSNPIQSKPIKKDPVITQQEIKERFIRHARLLNTKIGKEDCF